MEILKVLRIFILLISFAMFCFQLHTATLNLMHPGLVDINHERDITDDDMPLITVCPTNQIEDRWSYNNMLVGSAYCSETTRCTTWGSHLNLTFDKLKDQVFELDKVESIEMLEGGKFKDSSTFIPGYGVCREASFLNHTQIVFMHYNLEDAWIFITNRNYRSFIMPDEGSHVGKEIFMKPGKEHYINVKITIKSYCKRDEIPMSEEDFKNCVDDKIQEDFEKNNISCVPPWLSYNKQCNQTYPEPSQFYGKF